jgi:hypothetical protein
VFTYLYCSQIAIRRRAAIGSTKCGDDRFLFPSYVRTVCMLVCMCIHS